MQNYNPLQNLTSYTCSVEKNIHRHGASAAERPLPTDTSDQMPWWANTSNCGQRELGCRHQTVEVFGVERTVGSVEDIPATWQCWHCYFLPDGHLASRMQEELKAEHVSNLRQHQELRAMMADFLQFLYQRKPRNVFMFASKDFSPVASCRPPWGTFNTSLS
uniref:Ciliogenesis-associated TTC17-interacting protein n=1 Tax=Hucho hucho TaxID=62062 RepID=A0A4W5PS85_9TELE